MQRTSLFFLKPSEWKSGLLSCVSTTLGLTGARGFRVMFLVKSLFCYRVYLLPEPYKWVTDELLGKSEIYCFKYLCPRLSSCSTFACSRSYPHSFEAASILQVKERTSTMTTMNASKSYTIWKISIGTAQSIKQIHRICLDNFGI